MSSSTCCSELLIMRKTKKTGNHGLQRKQQADAVNVTKTGEMEYLTFCGIKLRGNTSEILSKFRDRGFEITSDTTSISDGEDVCMSGILYDEKCEVTMRYSSAYDGFYNIEIHLTRKHHYWEQLLGKYNEIKKAMEESYSAKHFPVQSSFNRKFKRGNNNEMKYLDDANYIAKFFLPLFHVGISIQKDATIKIQIHDNIYEETILEKKNDLTTEVYK